MATYSQPVRTPVYQFSENAAVVTTTETTIVSYTVPASTTVFIQGVVCTGTADFRFKLKVDGTTKLVGRISAAEQNFMADLEDGGISATAGQVVTITAFHTEASSQGASTAFYGYTES